ncbi:MAG: hypothetical protein ACYCVB_04990, partial [Bacilli bacterium]
DAVRDTDDKVGYRFIETRLPHADAPFSDASFVEGQTQKELSDVHDRLLRTHSLFVERISQICKGGGEATARKIECSEVDAGMGRDWIEDLASVLSRCLTEFAYSPVEPRATEVLLAAEAQLAIVVRSLESGALSVHYAMEHAASFPRTLGESLEILRRHGLGSKTKPTAQIYYATFEDDNPSFRWPDDGVGA